MIERGKIMLALILKGELTGQVRDLTNTRPHIYETDEEEEFTISEFVPIDTIEAERETKLQNMVKLAEEIGIIDGYLRKLL